MNLIEGHRPVTPADGIPVWETDPYDPAVLADPYPWWGELRRRGEIVFIPKWSAFAVGRYEVTKTTFSDHEVFVSSRGVGLNDFKLDDPWRPPSIILEVDPPDHTKTRKVMSRALSPKVAKGLAEQFRDAADALVDELIALGEVEGVADIAEAFPVAVFPRAVGMTDVHKRHLVDYGAIVFNSHGPDSAIRRAAMERAPGVSAWIDAACARDRLTEEGLGGMIYAAADEGEIDEDEAAMLVRSFLSAGVDTTVTGIGSALWCFSRNPDQWETLKANPKLIRPAF